MNRGGLSTLASGFAGMRPATLGYNGAVGPRPITQSELATALALASTPESSAVTPTTGNQVQCTSIDYTYHYRVYKYIYISI